MMKRIPILSVMLVRKAAEDSIADGALLILGTSKGTADG